MKRTGRLGTRGLLIALAISLGLVTSCTSSSPSIGGEASGPLTIECQVFYRTAAGERFDESIVTLGTDNGAQSLDYDQLAFVAQFYDDAGEGPSLSIATTDRDTGREIARQLCQIDRSKGLANQFIGGHGFTGLQYVFHPTSTAELQYFCQAK